MDETTVLPNVGGKWMWQASEEVTVLAHEARDGERWVMLRGTEGSTWTTLDHFRKMTNWDGK